MKAEVNECDLTLVVVWPIWTVHVEAGERSRDPDGERCREKLRCECRQVEAAAGERDGGGENFDDPPDPLRRVEDHGEVDNRGYEEEDDQRPSDLMAYVKGDGGFHRERLVGEGLP
jgi:hypothetical protein